MAGYDNLKPVGNVDDRNSWAPDNVAQNDRSRRAPDWLFPKLFKNVGQSQGSDSAKKGGLRPNHLAHPDQAES